VALEWLDPYIVGHYWLEVANDVFNSVAMPGLVILRRRTRSAAWRRAVGSLYTVAVPGEWSAALALHCSCTIVVYPHVLQTLTAVPARTSCRCMMALTSGTLETCTRALGTGEPCCIGWFAGLLLMLEARDPHRTVGRVAARSPPRRRHDLVPRDTRRSRATVHVMTSEPTLAGRQIPEPLDT
jgi:hypothetical protein